MLGHFQRAADGCGAPVSYVISTGNEIGLESTDFLLVLLTTPHQRAVVYTEQSGVRENSSTRSSAAGAAQPVILMFPGQREVAAGRAIAHRSAGRRLCEMRVLAEDAGANRRDHDGRMMDLAEIMVRYPKPR